MAGTGKARAAGHVLIATADAQFTEADISTALASTRLGEWVCLATAYKAKPNISVVTARRDQSNGRMAAAFGEAVGS